MSRRTRILLGILVVYVGAVVFLLYRVSLDIDPRYRESAEESLVDTANLLATLLERQAYGGVIQTEELERTLQHLSRRPLKAKIFQIEKTAVVLHDSDRRRRHVLFDSTARHRQGLPRLARCPPHWMANTARATLADPEDRPRPSCTSAPQSANAPRRRRRTDRRRAQRRQAVAAFTPSLRTRARSSSSSAASRSVRLRCCF
jgi:hypothetical protein